jgi:hypothetical protein
MVNLAYYSMQKLLHHKINLVPISVAPIGSGNYLFHFLFRGRAMVEMVLHIARSEKLTVVLGAILFALFVVAFCTLPI